MSEPSRKQKRLNQRDLLALFSRRSLPHKRLRGPASSCSRVRPRNGDIGDPLLFYARRRSDGFREVFTESCRSFATRLSNCGQLSAGLPR